MSETLGAILENPNLNRSLARVKAVREAAVLLRESRGRSGLTQGQLAEKLKVTQSFISQLESGKMESAPALATLADALAVCGEALRVTTAREVEGLHARIKFLEGEAERFKQPMIAVNQPPLSRALQSAVRTAAIKSVTTVHAKVDPWMTVTHDGDRVVLKLDVAEEFLPDLQPLKANPMALDLLSARQIKNVSDFLGNTAVELNAAVRPPSLKDEA